MVIEKLTFGEQINANIEKQDRSPDKQEIGETAEELYFKTFMPMLLSAIQSARKAGMFGKIYIHVIETGDQHQRNVVHWKPIVRRTKPDMEPQTYLYSHHHGDDEPTLEWVLPAIGAMDFMMTNPSDYPKNNIKWILQYQEEALRKAKALEFKLRQKAKSKLILPPNY